MKISVDAGALCTPRHSQFGTYTVTRNILEALGRYDSDNQYTAYTFTKVHDPVLSQKNLHQKVLRPSFAWMSARVSMQEILYPGDIYLGLNQAIPWLTRSRIFSFLHGVSFFIRKDLYPDSYEALKDQVLFAISRSEKVIVSSVRVKEDLEEHFRFKDTVVIPFGVPFDMRRHAKEHKAGKKQYFLFVGMNHPIKNLDFLLKAFKIFKEHPAYKEFELLLVGPHHAYGDAENKIRCLNPGREELKKLYQEATAYLSASLYESFNFPVLEALSQGTAVIARSSAIIPEYKPFVHVGDEVEEFVELMKQSSRYEQKSHQPVVERKFNWETYVSKLTSLYKL